MNNDDRGIGNFYAPLHVSYSWVINCRYGYCKRKGLGLWSISLSGHVIEYGINVDGKLRLMKQIGW